MENGQALGDCSNGQKSTKQSVRKISRERRQLKIDVPKRTKSTEKVAGRDKERK